MRPASRRKPVASSAKSDAASLTHTEPSSNECVRLNKALADSGLCARRKADSWIQNGLVTVNGQVVTAPGHRVNPAGDTILVSGKPLLFRQKRYIAFHKPVGVVCSRKSTRAATLRPQKTIYDLLPPDLHSLDPACRLDVQSSGLLILSNDGQFIYRLTHPRYEHPKVYEVMLHAPLTAEQQSRLLKGVMLQPENRLACAVRITASEEYPRKLEACRITLTTGYNRQIRRTIEAVGNRVRQLKRVSMGTVTLGDIPVGHFRELLPLEWQAVLKNNKET